jgi:hypothetical protein
MQVCIATVNGCSPLDGFELAQESPLLKGLKALQTMQRIK